MVALAAVLLAACGGSGSEGETGSGSSTPASSPVSTGDTSPATVAPNGESVTVQALDNTFRVQDLTIAAGTEVVWENVGRNDHNVVPVGDPEATAWGVLTADFAPGDEYSHVFSTPGTFPYYCTIHGTEQAGMVGTITVTGA